MAPSGRRASVLPLSTGHGSLSQGASVASLQNNFLLSLKRRCVCLRSCASLPAMGTTAHRLFALSRSHNPSVERTANGEARLRSCAAEAPLPAAHLER